MAASCAKIDIELVKDDIVDELRLLNIDAAINMNRYWEGYLFKNGDVYARWGRIGYESGRVLHKGGGRTKLEQLRRAKEKKGYTQQRTISGTAANGGKVQSVGQSQLKSIATQQIQGDAETKKLVAWLAEVNVHQITKNTQITFDASAGTFSTPLGLVTADGISDARDLLNDIAPLVVARNWNNKKFMQLVGDYLRIIPQNVGMRRGWHETMFAPSDALTKQSDILDALDVSLLSASTVKPTKASKGKQEQVFNVSLKTVDVNEFKRIDKKYKSDKGSHYDVRSYYPKKAWAIHITTVREAFEKKGRKLGNVKELWHGTSSSHLLSIMRQGLVVPPASSPHVTGRLYGSGCYFSDMSSKSLRYATGGWGKSATNRIFMLLANVAMGKSYSPSGYLSGSFRLPVGYDSCFAKGGVASVINNEMIVYHTCQCDLVYLVEFTK